MGFERYILTIKGRNRTVVYVVDTTDRDESRRVSKMRWPD